MEKWSGVWNGDGEQENTRLGHRKTGVVTGDDQRMTWCYRL